jgi:epoxyqueuosine reductase
MRERLLSSIDSKHLKEEIRALGLALGFDKIGFAPAGIPHEAPRLDSWLARGHQGDMRWMARDPNRRTDTTKIRRWSKTVVCCALNYYQGSPEPISAKRGIFSAYARGEDYHRVLEEKLDELAGQIQERCRCETRTYVDTGPLLEKSYSAAAGLGWPGKHSNLVSRQGSSWFFLGEILISVELPPDPIERDHCGTCNRCITACPTNAIVAPYVVDSRLCISYLTIELRSFIPRELRPMMGLHIYGCDDCQDVCPWNRFAKKSDESRFLPREPLFTLDLLGMLRMSHEDFLAATKVSAIRRARYGGFLRNVVVAIGNAGDPCVVPALLHVLDHSEVLVRGHAAWALGHLGRPDAREPLAHRLEKEESEEVKEEIRWALAELDRQA